MDINRIQSLARFRRFLANSLTAACGAKPEARQTIVLHLQGMESGLRILDDDSLADEVKRTINDIESI